jgi:hypothetical protein
MVKELLHKVEIKITSIMTTIYKTSGTQKRDKNLWICSIEEGTEIQTKGI